MVESAPSPSPAPSGDGAEARRMIGPYRIERRLGAGGMGTVYAARAPGAGTPVALKVLHPHLAAAGVRERFLREARVGAQVDHPGVVRTLDSGTDDSLAPPLDYLVMEHVEGRTLAALLEAWGAIPEALLREIGRQAADALAAIHAAGVVHRDLKPENLMLTSDHRLRIMDLGIARLGEGESRLTETGQFVGSLLYAAPEQIEGGEAEPATDLYALGVVLHELASGANPFRRTDPGAVLRARLATPVPPLASVAPRCSAFLAAVVDLLVHRRPEQRFPSAAALRSVLEEGEQGAWWGAHGADARPRMSVPHGTPFRGRAEVLARLDDAWASAVGGAGATVEVYGADGMGKTRLFSEFVSRHPTGAAEILVAAGAGGLGGALAERLAGEEGQALLASAFEGHEAWLPAFTAWVREEIPPTDGPRLDPGTRAALVVRVLERLAASRPVVLVLDDLDEADRDDLSLAARILAGTPGVRRLALIGARTRTPEIARALRDQRVFERIDLEPLGAEDAARLVTDVLGEADAARADAARVAAFAGGVPLFVLALARDLQADPDSHALRVPESIKEQVLRRTARLEGTEAEILELAAVAGHTFDADPIARVRGSTRLQVLAALGRLERHHGLVRSVGARFQFDHPVVHEIVYRGVPAALRGEIHRLLAEALLPEGGEDDPASVPPAAGTEVVRHFLRSSEPQRAVSFLDRTVSHLHAAFRSSDLVDVLERAVDLEGVHPVQRVRWMRALALPLQRLGRSEEAKQVYLDAVAEADAHAGPEDRAETRCGVGAVLQNQGDYDGALAWFEEARRLLDPDGPPEQVGFTLGWIGQTYWHMGRYAEAEAVQKEVIELGAATNRPKVVSRGLANLAVLMHETGRLAEATSIARRAIELHAETGDRRNEATTISNLGNVHFDSGRLLDALHCYEKSLATCRALVFRDGEAVALLNVANARARLGESGRADAALKASLALCRFVGLRRVEGYVRHVHGDMELARGELAAAQEHLEAALAIREELGDRRSVATTRQLLGAVADAAGDGVRACAQLEQAYADAVETGEINAEVLAQARLAALRGEGGEAAAARFDELGDRLRYLARLEGGLLLWRATGDVARLAASKQALAEEAERLPAARRESFLAGVRLHAEITRAG